MTEDVVPVEVEVTADDPEDVDEVYSELRGVTGVTVTEVPAPTVPGAPGVALDVLWADTLEQDRLVKLAIYSGRTGIATLLPQAGRR